MPGINKTRVANVNFMNNTRRYDDLVIPMNSLNSLIDGENGDGKTLYAQCIFQSIIPNSYFHPDNTIKKLFKDNSNTTIHSMIEWELDKGNEYDFMITGFCAKDTQKDNTDDKRVFEHFNYVILYKKEFPFSVESIPLKVQKDDKVSRMGFKKLKEYLRDLGNNENRCFVKTFTIKRDYLNFLYNYGINESEWTLLFNTNRQEGGAENYFTTKYKSPKDVLTQELIPIIESIDRYRLGEESTNEVLAKSLFNISKNIKQLSEKSQRLNELSVVETCLNRIVQFNDDLKRALEDKNETFLEIVRGYNKEVFMEKEISSRIDELENKRLNLKQECENITILIQEISEKIKDKDLEKEQLDLELKEVDRIEKILENRNRRTNLLKEVEDLKSNRELILVEIDKLSSNIKGLKSKLEDLRKIKDEKKAENIYLEYKSINNKAYQNQLKLETCNKSSEEILEKKKEAESMYLYALNRLEEDVNNKIALITQELEKIDFNIKDTSNKIIENNTNLNKNKMNVDNHRKEIKKSNDEEASLLIKNKELESNANSLIDEIRELVEKIKIENLDRFNELNIDTNNLLLSLDKTILLIDMCEIDSIPVIISDNIVNLLKNSEKSILEHIRALKEKRELLENDTHKATLQLKLEELNKDRTKSFEEENKLFKMLNEVNSSKNTNEYKIEELIKMLDTYKENIFSIKSIIDENNAEDRFDCEIILNAKVSELKNKLSEIMIIRKELDSKLIDLNNNEGLSLSKDTIKCYDMIASVYKSALLGREFIKSLPVTTKEQYLSKTTLIPYGVLLNENDYNSLIQNESLKNKMGDILIPIINMDCLKNTDSIDETIVYFNTLSKEVFIDEDRIQEEIKKIESKLSKLEKEIDSIEDELKIYENQLRKITSINLKYEAKFEDDKSNEVLKYQDLNRTLTDEIKAIEEKISSISKIKDEINKNIADTKDEIEKHEADIKSKIKNVNTNLDLYQKVLNMNSSKLEQSNIVSLKLKSYVEIKDKISENTLDIKKISDKKREFEENISLLQEEAKDIKDKMSALNLKNIELEELKKEKDSSKSDNILKLKEVLSYKLDIPVGTIEKETTLTIDKLKEMVKIVNRKIEKEFSEIKDLEDDIKEAVEHCERKKSEIESLNISFKLLDSKSETLTYNDSKVFNSIDKRINAVNTELESNIKELELVKVDEVKVSTTIQNKMTDAERIDISEDIIIEDGYNVEEKRTNINRLIKNLKEDKKSLEDESKKYSKSISAHYDEISEIEDVIRSEESDLKEVSAQKFKTENLMELNNIDKSMTEDIADNLDFIVKNASKKIEWHNNKIESIKLKHEKEINNTCDRLEDSVFEFVSVLKDIKSPGTIEEIIVQNTNITSEEGYLHYLNQERESLDKELEDLNLMKSEFINKCVGSVEILIDKLNNISKQSTVVLNDKKVRLIELKLYELNKEQKIEKMSNYIDNLLKLVDKECEDNQEESIRVLNQALTASRLLEQGVRNLKNCELNIYVPNPVNVENGYYEKWCGGASSGQRNMMYLTAVMALIVFIRESSSLKGASENTKVIFGDGPFRGAHASYLWEPVFKLMKDNNMQFIVTNYATPPALTPLFSSTAKIAGVNTLFNGKPIIQNELTMESRFKENTKSLRGENILVKYEDYKIPVVRKTAQKDANVDDSQLTLDSFMNTMDEI